MMQSGKVFLLGLLALTLAGCSARRAQYVIGVSQCSDDIWREKQNAELRMGAYLHSDVELRFAAAYDSDERQVEQIDSLVRSGIDLLIVAPNQVQTISPAIDRAYDEGIPVIVFERKTSSNKYTAFMGADNYEMGRLMGEYVVSRLQGQGRVLEVMGLKGSSPAIERHKGFADALAGSPGIESVATLQGDWTEQSAYSAVKACEEDLGHIDFVFGQNDRMAIGARRAMMERFPQGGASGGLTRFCGIDGLPGENGGIKLVRDSVLDATYIYPTHGDQLLQLAVDILEGRPYEKETSLMSALVTSENARVLLMQNEEMVRQSDYLDRLHQKADDYLQQLDTQRLLSLLAIVLVVLLLVVVAITYLYFLQRARIHEERTRMEREQLDFYTQVAHELRTPLTLIEGPLEQLAATSDIQQAGQQASSLFDIVRRNTTQLTRLVSKLLEGEATPVPAAQNDWNLEPTSATPEPQNVAVSSESADQASSLTLLIVDDNADIRAYLRTILSPRYQLLEAEDGKAGLELARQEVPDLIVSDVMMPVMNGLEFCQQVKGDYVTSHVPVILLTARALSRHQVEGYASGADAYITKPFQAEVLLARIENLLKSRKMLKDLWGRADDSKAPVEEPAAELVVEESSSPFIARFKQVVDTRLENSELGVEDIAAEMALSRVQLYRKVKALTGQSPVELLRKARLARGRQLLETTDKSISEVAYAVGFTAPSYFTKCFKDEFGLSPTELKQ